MEPTTTGSGLPPQNAEAEASLLGALLIDSDAIVKIADTVSARDFYDKRHERIYSAIVELYDQHKACLLYTSPANFFRYQIDKFACWSTRWIINRNASKRYRILYNLVMI